MGRTEKVQVWQRGFTLIELLVVLGILGVLILATFLTLNPGEAQKKARDQKRTKDLGTLVTIVDQYLNDGGEAVCTGESGCSSSSAGTGLQAQPCDNNWLGINACRYATTVAVDPNNAVTRTFITGGTTQTPTTASLTAGYRVKMEAGKYEVNVLQESVAGLSILSGDGGNSSRWVESGNDLTLLGD